jgi:SAM-dependent methyltransferase
VTAATLHLLLPTRWPWPLPALLAWGLAWCTWHAALAAGLPAPWALAMATSLGLLLALGCRGTWRRLLVATGFPLAALLQGAAAGWPAWAWLVMLLPLLLAYPVRAWRDAPLFPTPAGALAGLPGVVGSPRSVLDAGCGLGHGLRALRAAWPAAQLHGIEWSPLLALATRCTCGFARVRRGDMWRPSWAGHDLVYLFQRPESMARAWAKATTEMVPGSWLVSLEFAVPGVRPWARIEAGPQRALWIYRVAEGTAASSGSTEPACGR